MTSPAALSPYVNQDRYSATDEEYEPRRYRNRRGTAHPEPPGEQEGYGFSGHLPGEPVQALRINPRQGLQPCAGTFVHPGIVAPTRSASASANAHRPWQLFPQPCFCLLAYCRTVRHAVPVQEYAGVPRRYRDCPLCCLIRSGSFSSYARGHQVAIMKPECETSGSGHVFSSKRRRESGGRRTCYAGNERSGQHAHLFSSDLRNR